jgi:hypothetical protein
MISVIATSDMNPTKPPRTASVGDLLRKEHGTGSEEQTLEPSKRARIGTGKMELIALPPRQVLPPDG